MDWKDLEEEWKNANNYITCYTSGSTGSPQKIHLPKKEMERSALRTISHFNLDSNSHLHSCISPDFIGGKMMYIRSQILGSDFSWEIPSNKPLSQYKSNKIDLLSVVPSQMINLLERRKDLPEIAAILVGGSPINDSLRRKIVESGMNVWETYGMTETASHIALRRVSNPEKPFIPLEGIKIRLVDECLEIEITGWKKILTNDIANIDHNGAFRILGRSDNVFISGGIKIHPEDIERRLATEFDFPFMIFGVEDELWGKKCTIKVENTQLTDEAILERCGKILSNREKPKEVIRGEIRYTKNGKIKRIL